MKKLCFFLIILVVLTACTHAAINRSSLSNTISTVVGTETPAPTPTWEPIPSETLEPTQTPFPTLMPTLEPSPIIDTSLHQNYDCSLLQHLPTDSPEAQQIVRQFVTNFQQDWPTEYMAFEQLWSVDRLGEYAVIQGLVTQEESDLIVVQQTQRGFVMVTRYIANTLMPGVRPTDIPGYLAAKLPDAPPELFYCLERLPEEDIHLQQLGELNSDTETPSPALTPVVFPTPGPGKETLVLYTGLPGDGGWCMADYLGETAPLFVLYTDGQLLVRNPLGTPSWFAETQLGKEDMVSLLNRYVLDYNQRSIILFI